MRAVVFMMEIVTVVEADGRDSEAGSEGEGDCAWDDIVEGLRSMCD